MKCWTHKVRLACVALFPQITIPQFKNCILYFVRSTLTLKQFDHLKLLTK